jgi:hypothetical protein
LVALVIKLKTVIVKGGIGVNCRFETLALIWIKVFGNFTISYLKISSSSWKTAKKSYKGALRSKTLPSDVKCIFEIAFNYKIVPIQVAERF